MPQAKGGRSVPRIAAVAVAMLAVGASLVLVGLAWRSNRAARNEPADATVFTDGQAAPGGGGDAFVGCTDCHKDLDKVFENGGVPLLLYRHETHFAKGVSDCSVCHFPNTHEADRINKPTMARCFVCHGTTEQAIAPGACSTCHPPGIPSKPETHLVGDWVPKEHAKIAKDDSFQCTACHRPSFCSSCHGLEMPHPQGWAERPHVAAYFDEAGTTCERCHAQPVNARDFCDSCHHPRGPSRVGWREFHPNVVREQATTSCFECHNPTTCATCHVEGRETFKADENWQPAALPSPSGG